MLSGSVGRRLLQCCRLATRDRGLWMSGKECVWGKSVCPPVLTCTSQCGFSTETNSKQQPSQPASAMTGPDDRGHRSADTAKLPVRDAAAHLLVKQQLESRVRECNTVAAVLCQIVDVKMHPILTNIVLERLSQLVRLDPDKGREEIEAAIPTPLFAKLGDALEQDIHRLPVSVLLGCLNSLLSLTPADIHLIKSLETQITWLMRRLTIGQLVRVLEIHANHQETELRRQVYREALASIEKRWVEISNPRDLVTLLYLTLQNSHKLSDKLEEKALDLAEEMSPKELYRVAYLLAKKRHRNTPLLRAITYHLNKSKLSLSPVQFCNLLFACSSLNVCDSNLLEKICLGLRQQIRQGTLNNTHLHPSILFSLANLRWQNQLTIDILMESVQKNVDSFSEKELASVVCSIAILNYSPPPVSALLTAVREKLSEALGLEPGLWLDVVWSLAALKLLTPSLAASVLNPDFFFSVADDDAFKTLRRHIKLLNIQAATEYELEDYSGPKLPPFADNEMAKSLLRGGRGLATSVLTVLNSMAPSDQYMRTSTFSQTGYFIDADLFVNLSGQPLVFSDFCDKPTAGVKRLAVRVLDFNDLMMDTRVPTGLHMMAARHTAAEGYTVIQIPYTEFDERGTTVQKVQYIQQKINVAIGKTPPPSSAVETS